MNLNDAKLFQEVATRPEKCDVHGEFQSKNPFGRIWTKCPSCVADEDAREKAAAQEKALRDRQLAWLRKIGEAGIPDRFHDRRLETYVAETDAQKRALAFAKEFADGFDAALTSGRSAVFLGKPGTGKTHLAVGIGLQVMQRDRRTVLFTTVMRAIRRVKDTWSRGSEESETQAISGLVFPDLLILDEVGVQFGSDTEKLILFDVLNERYEKRRPTILISNLTLDEVKAYLGDRIFDRLREDGGEAIPFDWASHRGRA